MGRAKTLNGEKAKGSAFDSTVELTYSSYQLLLERERQRRGQLKFPAQKPSCVMMQ